MSPILLSFISFFFNDTATTKIYTLSLHDALPIYEATSDGCTCEGWGAGDFGSGVWGGANTDAGSGGNANIQVRSEEHTSELQSRFDLVCRLLLEKKKKKKKQLIKL